MKLITLSVLLHDESLDSSLRHQQSVSFRRALEDGFPLSWLLLRDQALDTTCWHAPRLRLESLWMDAWTGPAAAGVEKAEVQ